MKRKLSGIILVVAMVCMIVVPAYADNSTSVGQSSTVVASTPAPTSTLVVAPTPTAIPSTTPVPTVTAAPNVTPIEVTTKTTPTAIPSSTPVPTVTAVPNVKPVESTTKTAPPVKSPKTPKEKTVKTQTLKNNQNQLTQLQTGLKKLQDELTKIQGKIQEDITKMKTKVTNNVQNNQNKVTKINDKLKNVDDSLAKMQANDQTEQANLESDTQKWQDWVTKYTATLQKNLTDADTDLQKNIDAINKKIADSKTDVDKQKLKASLDLLIKDTQMKKDAITQYIKGLQAFWTDKQKIFAERKALLARRQALDTTYKNTMTTISKDQLNNSLINITPETTKTDDQIIAAVKARYQKNVDAINAKIKEIQNKITLLSGSITK